MSFRAWGPKNNKVFALSIGATQVDATVPVGFAGGGGQVKISNSGATDILIAFYKNADTKPTLTFPVTGAPPVGQGGQTTSYADGQFCATLVLHGTEKQISVPLACDSFSAIGSAAGPSIIYVQRGDGSV